MNVQLTGTIVNKSVPILLALSIAVVTMAFLSILTEQLVMVSQKGCKTY